MSCRVCNDTGWVQAAPLNEVNSASPRAAEHTPRVDWHDAVRIPCFSCFPTRLAVLT